MSHNLSKRNCYITSLAIEEMSGNIVEHGFDNKHKQFVDIMIAIQNGETIIRLRDNCQPFNPSERAEMFDPEDPAKNIGLRMIFKEVSGIDYSNILGLKNLIIRV